MNSDDVAIILERGEIDIVGRIADSSNQALLVNVELDGVSIPACYKTELGERPLWDFPEGLWRREVAAYRLSETLGFGIVPVTVPRFDGPYAPGSLQEWIDNTTGDHYFTLRERVDLATWFRQIAIFDIVANNTDRKSGHVIFDGERCWAIDQGLCFSRDASLRTVVWEFASQPLTESERDSLTELARLTTDPFEGLLSADESREVGRRAEFLAISGVFPAPNEDGDWPPYPWPLI